MQLAGAAARFLALFAVVSMAVAVSAGASLAKTPRMLDLRLGSHPDKTRVVMDLDQPVRYSHFVLTNPYRIVLVLPEIDFKALEPSTRARFGIAGYRFGLFKPDESRVVIDLEKPFQINKIFILPPRGQDAHRLVLDLVPTSHRAFVTASKDSIRRLKAGHGAAKPRILLPPLPMERGGKRWRIVIDPGHGGVDPGAIGVLGAHEKAVVLTASKIIKRILEQSGRYQVVLTRSRDLYIPLRQRVAIAHAAGADLFLSIHADSIGRRSVRGASVYTLSERASDKEAARLAEAENRSDITAGIDLEEEAPPEIKRFLIEMKQRKTMNRSAILAEYLAESLRTSVRTRKRAHRFAGFAVLKGLDVPSALLEIGYLSNPDDARLLRTRKFQETLARALLRGIDRYFGEIRAAAR